MGFPAPSSSSDTPLKFLIYGRTGWIGGLLGKLCTAQGIQFEYGSGRLENRSSLESDIAEIKPTHVFNAAGVTGRPNVDWCETHKVETIRANVVGTLTLADVCRERGLIVINFATGCIFEYDDLHLLGSGIGFKEEDTPNFIGSFYSKTKAMVCYIDLELFCLNMFKIDVFWIVLCNELSKCYYFIKFENADLLNYWLGLICLCVVFIFFLFTLDLFYIIF